MVFPFPHEIRCSDIDSGAIIAEYRAVHQPQAHVPFGLGEEHAVILGLLEETQDMLLGEKRQELTQQEYAEANPLPQPGEVGRGRNRGSDTTPIAARGADYLARRLARDRPDLFQRLKAGEFSSVRAAAKAAGIVKERTPGQELRRWWGKASTDN